MARTHGEISAYVHGCRCDECKRAQRDRLRRYRSGYRSYARQDPEEQAWRETEPEFFHAQLRPH